MPETLLYLQKAFSIFQEMRGRRVSQGMNCDRMVETCFCQGILHDDTDITRFDGLRSNTSAMRFKYKVITWEPLLEDAQQEKQLFRDGYDTVLLSLTLIDENLLAFKILGLAKRQSRADVNPLEAACLAYS